MKVEFTKCEQINITNDESFSVKKKKKRTNNSNIGRTCLKCKLLDPHPPPPPPNLPPNMNSGIYTCILQVGL